MITISAPGKLFIAGEYAVVEPGFSAVLVAVDRYVQVKLEESVSTGSIYSEQYDIQPLTWHRRDGKLVIDHEKRPFDYVLASIDIVEQLVLEQELPLRFFNLNISSELDDSSGRKFGLGSSAAVTVATIRALNELYRLQLDRQTLLKLAILATVQVNPLASGGDLAASMLGGWIYYTSPNREWLASELANIGIQKLLASDWPGFQAHKLPQPSGLEFVVGWTGEPASTQELVDSLHEIQENRPSGFYPEFLEKSKSCVAELIDGIRTNNSSAVLKAVHENRKILNQLSQSSGINIETAELTSLCDSAERLGAAAKSSGAGGGDCGIVLASEGTDLSQMYRDWELHDIRRLSLRVHPQEEN